MEEMNMAEQMKKERARRLFLIAFVLFTFANGFGGSIISNYFKGVYQVDSVQRGLLEIPRELPGVVGVFVITALSGCGNLTLAMISFCLYAVGMFVLGLLSPGYLLMQLFVFTYSLGDHIVMPVRDAIAMDLADALVDVDVRQVINYDKCQRTGAEDDQKHHCIQTAHHFVDLAEHIRIDRNRRNDVACQQLFRQFPVLLRTLRCMDINALVNRITSVIEFPCFR